MVIATFPTPKDPISPEKLKRLYEIRDSLLKEDVYSCDTETTGLDKHTAKITIISFATRNQKWAIRVRDYGIDLLRETFKPVFLDTGKTVVFHNFNYDAGLFRHVGIEFANRVACTMVMSWLYDEDHKRYSHGLKECVLVELGHRMKTYDEASGLFGDIYEYAGQDAWFTLKLYFVYLDKLAELGLLDTFWNIEMPVARVLLNVEYRGVRLSEEKLKILKKESFEELEKLERLIHVFAGMDVEKQRNLQKELSNILKNLKKENEERKKAKQDEFDVNKVYLDKQVEYCKNFVPRKFEVSSPLQCSKILFDELKIGMKQDGTNQYSERGKVTKAQPLGQFTTDDAALSFMAMDEHPIADLILKYREVNTRNNNFIKPLLERIRGAEDAIIRPQFLQIGTVTGRFASKDPNFQNLPKKGGVRAAFISRKGYKIIKCDYRQAELRIIAHLSKDETMIANYLVEGDIHQITADACGCSRSASKGINFGLCYRESAKRLKHQLAVDSGIIITLQEAEKFIKLYFAKYPKIKEFHHKVEETTFNRLRQSGKYGFVRSVSGRYRRLDGDYLTNHKTSYRGVTQMINFCVQGTVADLIKYAMVQVEKEFVRRGWLSIEKNIWDACVISQVHDELLVEAKEELAEEVKKIIQEKMLEAGVYYKIIVPMSTDAAIVDSLAKG